MHLFVSSRRRRGAALAPISDFMPVWPLARRPRPSVAAVTAKLEAWLGIQNAAAALRRGGSPAAPGARAG